METNIYYLMKLQFEPKEIRAIIMKDFNLTPENADKVCLLLIILNILYTFRCSQKSKVQKNIKLI